MIERFKAAYRAFVDPPEAQAVAVEEEPIPIQNPCPKCGIELTELIVQHITPASKTHYCKPCGKFFRPLTTKFQ